MWAGLGRGSGGVYRAWFGRWLALRAYKAEVDRLKVLGMAVGW